MTFSLAQDHWYLYQSQQAMYDILSVVHCNNVSILHHF